VVRRATTARPPAAPPRRVAGAWLDDGALLARLDREDFPATLWIEGPDEALKAAALAELRHAWAHACPEAPRARVFRAAEVGVDEILAAFHGGSLFTPRELLLVLEIEDLGRGDKKIAALAEGMVRPSGGTCLTLVESESDSARRALEPLRAASEARWIATPPDRARLLAWGRRRLERLAVTAEAGLLESVAEACEGDPAAYFNELDKLIAFAGPDARLTRAEAAQVLRPAVGAELPEYLAAVAAGDAGNAARRLSRVLAAGTSEGNVLFALGNLVGGAMGGWARHRDLSAALRRRCPPRELARALDAVYRAESAWKQGRADVVAVLEQATREVAGVTG